MQHDEYFRKKTILANLPKCRNYPPGRAISAPSADNFGTSSGIFTGTETKFHLTSILPLF